MAIKPGYKNTELGWIPNVWEVKKFSDISEVTSSKRILAEEYVEVGVPFYRSKEIIENSKNKKQSEFCYISYERFNDLKKRFGAPENGDMLITAVGSIGIPYLVGNEEFYFKDGNLIWLRKIDSNINKAFILNYIKSDIFQNSIDLMTSGSSQKALTIEKFENLKIPLPPLPEQKKIAEILSTWDKAIEKTEKLIDAKTKLKQGLMQKLLTGKLRFKEFEGEKWRTVNFGEVTELFSRRNKKLNGARIYSVTNNNGFVFQSDHFSREVAGEDLTNYKIIKKNEFAYNPARINVGSIAHFKDDIGVISSLYVCFRTTKDLLDEYMSYLLQIESTKFKIRNFGEGGVRVYLWYPLFATIKVTIPNIDEQKKISNSLKFLDLEIELLSKQLEALKEQKKGLMQKLLTGKVRVKV